MTVTKTQYANAKEALEAIQRLPVEAQEKILTMLRGAVVISDMYSTNGSVQPPVSAPVIKCKKTPRKKCKFVAEEAKKR